MKRLMLMFAALAFTAFTAFGDDTNATGIWKERGQRLGQRRAFEDLEPPCCARQTVATVGPGDPVKLLPQRRLAKISGFGLSYFRLDASALSRSYSSSPSYPATNTGTPNPFVSFVTLCEILRS